MKQSVKRRWIFIYLIGVALFMMTARCSFAAVSIERAKLIFSNLTYVNGIHATLRFKETPKVYASSGVATITIYTGMLQFCDNEAQLAFVIGHELGHITKHDAFRSGNKQMEYQADLLGYYYATNAGYPSGLSFMTKMIRVYGDGGGSNSDHPSWSSRLRYVLTGGQMR